jgi:hypothetical protein
LLRALQSTDQAVCHTAALVIPKIAVVDLPANQWPNLIQELLSNMNAPADSVAPGTRQVGAMLGCSWAPAANWRAGHGAGDPRACTSRPGQPACPDTPC